MIGAAFIEIKPSAGATPRPIANAWQAGDTINDANFALREAPGRRFANMKLPK